MNEASANGGVLPRGFEHLQDLVPEWTKATEHEVENSRSSG